MVAQYAIAGARVGVVIGTGHAAECRALALTLGAVDYLAHKSLTDIQSGDPSARAPCSARWPHSRGQWTQNSAYQLLLSRGYDVFGAKS
jgi:hypothetical protein